MSNSLSPTTKQRLAVQGFVGIEDEILAPVAPWLRLAFAGCATIAALGTALVSPILLWGLAVVAALAAIFPVHPFDLIYNYGIRHLTGTGALPKRAAPSRFACGLGSVWLAAVALSFAGGQMTLGSR